MWDANNNEFVKFYEGHTKGINGISWAADSTFFVTGSDDNTIRVWDKRTVYFK